MLPALRAGTVFGSSDAESAVEGPGRGLAGVSGEGQGGLPGAIPRGRKNDPGRRGGGVREAVPVSREVLLGRLRGVHRAPALPDRPQASDSDDQSSRAPLLF